MMWYAIGLAVIGCSLITLLKNPDLGYWDALAIGILAALLIAFAVMCAIIAMYRAARDYVDAETERELLARKDEPPEKKGLVRYELKVDARRWVYARIPTIAPEKLAAIAAGYLAGVPFTERAWRGEITNFRAIQDEFERRGLARKRGKTPQQGYKLTRDGLEALRDIDKKLAERIELPSPSEPSSALEYG